MEERRIAELTSSRSMKPVCLKSYNLKVTAKIPHWWVIYSGVDAKNSQSTCRKKACLNSSPLLVYHSRGSLGLQWILSSTGAFGWKTPKDRTNSPNSITPLRLTSNKSKICRIEARRCNLERRKNAMVSGNHCYLIRKGCTTYPVCEKVPPVLVPEECKLKFFL